MPSQEIKRPHIQESYLVLLKLQQTMFITFNDIKPVHITCEEKSSLEEKQKTSEGNSTRASTRMRKPTSRFEAHSGTNCCKNLGKEDDEMIACCFQGLCKSQEDMHMQDNMVCIHRDCAGLNDEKNEKKQRRMIGTVFDASLCSMRAFCRQKQ